MTRAFTRQPAWSLEKCEVTHISRQGIDLPLAIQQHEAFCQALRRMGVEVLQLPPVEAYPDSVFIEDNAIILDELAVLTSMGTDSRQGEPALLRSMLSQSRRLVEIFRPAMIEGGDVCRLGHTLYVGLSSRTNRAGVEALRAIIEPVGYDVMPIEVQGCLHLKTACTSLDDETVLVNPAWLDVAALGKVRQLQVPVEEPFGANVLRVPQGVLCNTSYPLTLNLMKSEGYIVSEIDISELSKAEAGLTCLSLMIE